MEVCFRAMVDDADAASESPGWEAINRALEPLDPGVEPQHWGTLLKWRLGGPDPLDGISIYEREDHWHYVSFGMSELYLKESEAEEVSGWGFEFPPHQRPGDAQRNDARCDCPRKVRQPPGVDPSSGDNMPQWPRQTPDRSPAGRPCHHQR